MVTGLLAAHRVKAEVKASSVEADVVVLPRPVAALMSLRYIAEELRRLDLTRYDCVLVPGMIPGDAGLVEERLGVPVFKGPKHASDLSLVLEALRAGLKLSRVQPACELLREELRRRALAELEEAERRAMGLRVGRGRRGVWVGGGSRIKVAAEVLDAPRLSCEELVARAARFAEEGADIIDLGMLSEDPRPWEVRRLVKAVKRAVGLPVSVDTLDEEEVVEAVKAGADMVLSVTPELAQRFDRVAKIDGYRRVAYVVIPFRPREGPVRGAKRRVEELLDTVEMLRGFGARKVIADPLLDPPIAPGCFEALEACRLLKARRPRLPVMLGAGNVTELIDADSPGVNALLAALAAEVGVDLLLTTEGSVKAEGSVAELAVAVRMMALAKMRGAPPKDLGIDLLRLKEKRRRDEELHLEGVEEVEAKGDEALELDPAGSFKVAVDRARGELVLVHYRRGELKPSLVIRGRRAFDLRDEVLRRGLVFSLKHAFYLGYELAKAELALKLGRSYVQDEDLV